MIRRLLALLLLALAAPVHADSPTARFSWLSYAGRDPFDDQHRLLPGEFRNPIIPGFHPDPSILRVGQDFYIVNSSFAFHPGLPVFHSQDLMHWQQIGNAIDRPGMFDFSGLGIARAIFAPTIRAHEGRFLIIGTCVDCGGTFLLSADTPAGPWSNPVWLPEVDGVDPDLFTGSDGRAWVANNGPPVGPPRYDGHRAIWIQQIDLAGARMIGPRSVIVDGGVRPEDKPIWTEGPHIVERDGWHMLIAAEGGTAADHSVTVYRSRAVTGPYLPGPTNPILTQRDLAPGRQFPVQAAGHADFVQLQNGAWWTVFLGTRPSVSNLSNMGRETFLLPVDWPKGGWPLILPAKTAVPLALQGPELQGPAPPTGAAPDRNRWRDDFTASRLGPQWLMLRAAGGTWMQTGAGAMHLEPRPVALGSLGHPAFVGRRQQHVDAVVETELRFAPARVGERAGLAVFADEAHHMFVGLSKTVSGPMLVVMKRNGTSDPEAGQVIGSAPFAAPAGTPLRLRIALRGGAVDFGYSIGGGPWTMLLEAVDGRMLASEMSNQFTGTVIGLHAASATSE